MVAARRDLGLVTDLAVLIEAQEVAAASNVIVSDLPTEVIIPAFARVQLNIGANKASNINQSAILIAAWTAGKIKLFVEGVPVVSFPPLRVAPPVTTPTTIPGAGPAGPATPPAPTVGGGGTTVLVNLDGTPIVTTVTAPNGSELGLVVRNIPSGPQVISGIVPVSQSGAPWSMVGTLTQNAAPPGANNLGVLPAIANAAPPARAEGMLGALSMDLAGNLRVAATISVGSDRTATGAIGAAQNVPINTQACGACAVQVTGVWTGTLLFEATVDGGTWNAVTAVVPTTGAEVTSATANGVWVIACAGFSQVRVRGDTVTSGTATVFLEASTATQSVILAEPLPAGANDIGKVRFSLPTSDAMSEAAINCSTNGNNIIIAGAPLQTIRVYRVFFVLSDSAVITIADSSPTDFTGPITMYAGGSFTLDFTGEPWFKTAAGEDLIINQAGTAQISGRIYYVRS